MRAGRQDVIAVVYVYRTVELKRRVHNNVLCFYVGTIRSNKCVRVYVIKFGCLVKVSKLALIILSVSLCIFFVFLCVCVCVDA
jgi:hypothetical protein